MRYFSTLGWAICLLGTTVWGKGTENKVPSKTAGSSEQTKMNREREAPSTLMPGTNELPAVEKLGKIHDISSKPIQVTVYDNNLAFVRDTRSVVFEKGVHPLSFYGISEGLIPKTLFIRVLPKDLNLHIREQRLMLEAPSYRSLLRGSMGKTIGFTTHAGDLGRTTQLQGTLVGIEEPHTILVDIHGAIQRFVDPHILFDNKQHQLHGSPSLSGLFESPEKVNAQVELSYITSDMNWSTHYTAEVNDVDDSVDFLALTTLQNKTQVELRQAQILLAATLTPQPESLPLKASKTADARVDPSTPSPAKQGGALKEKALVEKPFLGSLKTVDFKSKDLRGNTYPLGQLVDISPGQSKNIVYAQATKMGGERQFWLVINVPYDRDADAVVSTIPVTSMISISNDQDSHLGLPLPGGSLLVYHRTEDDFAKVSDQTRISHTPVGGKIPLRLGDAQGIEATVQQTDFKMLAPKVLETGYRVILKNTRDKPIVVRVLKELKPESVHSVVVIRENHNHRVENGLLWMMNVPAKDQVELRYRLQVTLPDEGG